MPNSTMIYVTHDQVEAMTLATRIVVLAGGRIAQVGTPMELYDRPNSTFVARFIGSPAMNLHNATIVETGSATRLKIDHGGGEITSDCPTRDTDLGRSVQVGIRPEDMVITEDENSAFQEKVEMTEVLGEVTLLYFEVAGASGDPVVAKLAGNHKAMRGSIAAFTARPEKVHLFSDGISLRAQAREASVPETLQ